MAVSIPLRFARSLSLARMRPNVPSIDFKPFLHGSAGDCQRIASEIDKALSSVGFIQLHNHGIELHKIDACLQWVSRVTPSFNTSWLVILNADRLQLAEQTTFRAFRVWEGDNQSIFSVT